MKSSHFEFLEKEPFETEYGVSGMLKEKQKEYRDTYTRSNLIGTCICILSPISLFIGAFSENEFLTVIMLSVMMVTVGIGVIFFITAGVKWSSMQKLLREGDYAPKKKQENRIRGTVAGIYWPVATGIYLFLLFNPSTSFLSWIVWPVAGVLFAAVMALCGLFEKNEKE